MSIDAPAEAKPKRAAARVAAYEQRTSFVMVVLSLVYLAIFAVQVLVVSLDGSVSQVLQIVSDVIWATFVIDLVIRVYLAPQRLQYLVSHPVDVAAAVLPAFRVLRVLRVLTAAQWLVSRGQRFAFGRVAVAVVISVSFLALIGGLAVLGAERGQPGANIETFGESIWWALVTMATVGYGDYTPVTLEGRLIAVGMMVVGVSLLGVVSATLAATFVARIRGVSAEQADATKSEVVELRGEVARLQAGIDALMQAAGVQVETPGVQAPDAKVAEADQAPVPTQPAAV